MNIEILNMQGQTVFLAKIPAGETSVIWNAEGFPSGVYLARLKSGNNLVATSKLLLIR